jgi:putative DNA primase/helicase
MSWRNYNEVLSLLTGHGFIVERIEVGKMMRVKRSDHKQKGWYNLHEIRLDDGDTALIGSFGYFIGGESYKEKIAPGKGLRLTKDQLAAVKAQHAEAVKRANAEDARKAEIAARRATIAWSKYVTEGESDYLKRKGVLSHGLRFAPSGNGTIAIPMQDVNSSIYGLQIIRGKNRPAKYMEKEYWPRGLLKKGHFYLIGGTPKNILLIAEGYATAATLHEATGYPVAVAFDAYNLLPVALVLHKKYMRTKILVCGDDDYLTHGNPGCKAAEAAAIAAGGSWIKPIFPYDRDGKKLTDFNDLANFNNCSNSTVMVQIEDHLTQLGWGLDAAPKARASYFGGGGERQAAVSIMELDEAVYRFIPLDDGTGKYLFDTRTNKIVLKDQMIAILQAGVRWDDVKRHPDWINRGAYYLDEIGFDPTENDTKVKLNTWTGWELKPKQGSCEKLLETLEYLCSKEKNSDEVLWWILKWMAYPLQNPGAKMLSAIILHGPQGTGKSLIFRTLASIYGKYATVIGNRGIEDKFNADWADSKLFILAEEVATSADKWQIKNELKELVTGETVRVNPKNIAAYSQKNQMNIAFLSNEDMPLPIENDDRRHLVVYTPPCLPEQHYIDALIERDEGGIEAFYHYLMQMDLTGFNRYTKPPSTTAKENLITLSLPSDKRFIKEWMDGDTQWPCVPCLSMDLYKAYIQWCKANGETRPRPSNQFLGMVNNLTGWESGLRRVFDTLLFKGETKPKRMVIPPQYIQITVNGNKTMRQIYDEKKPNETEAQWLTGFLIDFQSADRDETATE